MIYGVYHRNTIYHQWPLMSAVFFGEDDLHRSFLTSWLPMAQNDRPFNLGPLVINHGYRSISFPPEMDGVIPRANLTCLPFGNLTEPWKARSCFIGNLQTKTFPWLRQFCPMALKKCSHPWFSISLPCGFSYGFSDEIRFKIHPFGCRRKNLEAARRAASWKFRPEGGQGLRRP